MAAERGLSLRQAVVKRAVDVLVAGVGLVLASPLLAAAWVVASLDTRQSGLFRQVRVGRHGQLFEVYKLRTMRSVPAITSTVTTSDDARITWSGRWMRRLKLDELPQLVNVLRGEMSMVGPRPDVPGYADLLQGEDRIVLSVRPGVTGPAAVAYRQEEALLAGVADPESYNRDVIWPDKVRINRAYVEHYSLLMDVRYLAATLAGIFDGEASGSDSAREEARD